MPLRRADNDLRGLSQAIQLGVRCDRAGSPLVDFHTVVGGVMSAEGKIKVNATTREPETVVSRRHYLSDASFLVAVQSQDATLISNLAAALQQPVWPIYLGRKSCPPSRPLFVALGDYRTMAAALTALPLRSRGKEESTRVRAVLECPPQQGVRRRDEVDMSSVRTFLPRYTREVLLTVSVQPEET